MDTRIPYRERYIRKVESLFGKSREYICFSDDTYKEFVEFINNLKGIEWGEVSTDFEDIIEPDIDIDDLSIEEITLHYDDDGETAIYDIKISAETFPIEMKKIDDELVLWIAEVRVKGNLAIQIQRDLRNLEESGISFKSFSYDVLSNRDSEEALLEIKEEALSETMDTLEDYYNH